MGETVSGACSVRCACNVGDVCDLGSACAPGLFCMRRGSSPTTCQPCTLCDTDAAARDAEGCSASCPAGPTSSLLGAAPGVAGSISTDALVTASVYLSFAFEPWRDPGSNRTKVTTQELIRFLANEPDLQKVINGSTVANVTYMQQAVAAVRPEVDFRADVPIPLATVAAVLYNGSRAMLCPKIDASQPASAMARVTGPGCPCNYTVSAEFNRCPNGYICSRQGFLGLSTDAFYDPTWGQLRAVCVPCTVGQFCREGSLANITTGITKVTRTLDCPLGYYCPSPGQAILCPAGSYCVSRALNYTTCNITDLFNAPDALVPPDPGDDLITRLKKNREPIRGNYCPPGSTKSGNACAAGYYCPNASTQIICPEGSYCKSQSIEPVPCPWLARCPKGTAAPDGRPLAGLIFGLIVVFMYLSKWLLQFVYWAVERIVRTRGLLVRLREGLPDDVADALGLRVEHASAGGARFSLEEACKKSHWDIEERNNMRFSRVKWSFNRKPQSGDEYDKGISGIFEAGQLSAVMGPSGCGKTTFIKLLSGRVRAPVTVFNEEKHKVALTETRYRRKLGYVPQDDILHSDLTVRENLSFSSYLKLPIRTPYRERRDIVDDTLCMLGMYDKRDSIVGSVERPVISGGERKRVSIGVEIVGKPPILFMDEPTSGLDAARSSELITILTQLAAAAMTNIITVIHQPRYKSFTMFDKLVLLAKGGKLLYMGPPTLAIAYFRILGFPFPRDENDADTILDIVSENSVIRSAVGIRSNELPYVWYTRGQAWLHSFNRPIERWRRVIKACILDRRMKKLAVKKTVVEDVEAKQRAEMRAKFRLQEEESKKAEEEAVQKAVAEEEALAAATSVATVVTTRSGTAAATRSGDAARKARANRDELQGRMRRKWLDTKLTKLFPRYQQDAAYLEQKNRSVEEYEQELQGESSDDDSFSGPDIDGGEEPDSDDEAVILLLKYPNRGDHRMDESMSRTASGREVDRAAQAARAVPVLAQMPSLLRQLWRDMLTLIFEWCVLFGRNVIKSTRAFWPGTVLDVLLLLGAAFIVGAVQGSKWGLSSVPSNASMTYLVLSVLSSVVHLRTFSVWRNVQLRERMSGVSSLATFLSSNTWDMIWIYLSPAIYLSVYYYVALPRADFFDYYIIGVLVCFWSSGMSYVVSISTIPPQAQLITTVILSLILGAFLQGLSPSIKTARGSFLEVVLGLSYNRWAMEAATIQEFKKYISFKSNEMLMIYYGVGICRMDVTLIDDGDDVVSTEETLSFISVWSTFNEGTCDKYYGQAMSILMCMGIGMRILAFGQLYIHTHSQWFEVQKDKVVHAILDITGIDYIIDTIQARRKLAIKRAKEAYRVYLLRTAQAGAGRSAGAPAPSIIGVPIMDKNLKPYAPVGTAGGVANAV